MNHSVNSTSSSQKADIARAISDAEELESGQIVEPKHEKSEKSIDHKSKKIKKPRRRNQNHNQILVLSNLKKIDGASTLKIIHGTW
jgi:hypothetical protein